MGNIFSPHATLEQFKQDAKRLLKSFKAGQTNARERIETFCPDDLKKGSFKLADAQRVIARGWGFESWSKLKSALDDKGPEDLIVQAAAKGDIKQITSLLELEPKLIEATGGWQAMRPLFFALLNDQQAAAEFLRSQGATLNIFEASKLGDVQTIQTLLEEDPTLVNARREHYDATPIFCVRDASLEAAQLLIDAGADVNAIDLEKQGLRPIHGRAAAGDVAMVKILLDHGADIQACGYMGTPLHAALGGFQISPPETWQEVAELLLARGADINADMAQWQDTGWTCLHHVAMRNHIDAAQWLIDKGINPNIKNRHGHLPIDTAKYFKHTEIENMIGSYMHESS